VPIKIVQFLALMLTALALVPAGAHLFELPNKIDLSKEAYFVVQGIYRGWALFGIVLIGALIANLALVVVQRHWGYPFALALLAFLLMAGSLAVFFTWTYPANQVSQLDRGPGELAAIAPTVGILPRRERVADIPFPLPRHALRPPHSGAATAAQELNERRGWTRGGSPSGR
jgi:hypothetical protein